MQGPGKQAHNMNVSLEDTGMGRYHCGGDALQEQLRTILQIGGLKAR